MFADAPDFNAWFPVPDGFPRPEWEAIRKFIESHSTEDHWSAAWTEIARAWLERTCQALNGSYTLSESDNFHLISELEPKDADQLHKFLERARIGIIQSLGDIQLPKRYGKHAVLRFTDQDDYYRYISYFDPDGAWAGTGGRFIRESGYMHIAYPFDDRRDAEQKTLAHELTHNLLYSFPLPLWLNEALAMLFERNIAGDDRFVLDHDIAAEHQAYWNSVTIQDFWSGKAFAIAEAQTVSYTLARILLDFIVTDIHPSPADFRDFVVHAHWKDSGQAAARDYLGVELNDLVSAFLGPGEWQPRPMTDDKTTANRQVTRDYDG